ncbi:MAG: hypothetical protein K0S11_169 [Gammaproteobacteria bacterium]|jgi:hypothetical protein|nr:hypothetical protein [Gammaproteobacteria bacterium]
MIKIHYPSGATPLEPDEIAGLIPDVQNQAELNAWELQIYIKLMPNAMIIFKPYV